MRLMRRTAQRILGLLLVVVFSGRLVACAEQQESASQSEIRARFAKAQQALAAHDSESAAAEFRAVLAIDPNNSEARANLGVIQFLAGDYAAAAAHFREVLKQQPPSSKAQALLGMCEKRLGQPAEARSLLEESMPKLPDGSLRTQAGLDLVEILYAAGDLDRAVDFIRILQKANPANVDVIYTAHRIYADLANSALDTLVLTAPDSARMHQAIGQRLINEGDAHGAVAQYSTALQTDPRLPGVHNELGQAILEESTSDSALDQAESEFKLALAQNPADGSSEYWLGRIQSLRLNYSAALEYYAKALKLRPEYAELHVRTAEALIHMDQKQKALEHLQGSRSYRSAQFSRSLPPRRTLSQSWPRGGIEHRDESVPRPPTSR